MSSEDTENTEIRSPSFKWLPFAASPLHDGFKMKGNWSQLQTKACSQDVKDQSSAMMVGALGDISLWVCSSGVVEPIKMFELLDIWLASNSTAKRIRVLTVMYSNHISAYNDIGNISMNSKHSWRNLSAWLSRPRSCRHTKPPCSWPALRRRPGWRVQSPCCGLKTLTSCLGKPCPPISSKTGLN